MVDFKQQVEDCLYEIFGCEGSNERIITDIAKKAANLRSTLENRGEYELDLTVDKIRTHMENRSNGSPKWAWNNWIGALEFTNNVPDGYQL